MSSLDTPFPFLVAQDQLAGASSHGEASNLWDFTTIEHKVYEPLNDTKFPNADLWSRARQQCENLPGGFLKTLDS